MGKMKRQLARHRYEKEVQHIPQNIEQEHF